MAIRKPFRRTILSTRWLLMKARIIFIRCAGRNSGAKEIFGIIWGRISIYLSPPTGNISWGLLWNHLNSCKRDKPSMPGIYFINFPLKGVGQPCLCIDFSLSFFPCWNTKSPEKLLWFPKSRGLKPSKERLMSSEVSLGGSPWIAAIGGVLLTFQLSRFILGICVFQLVRWNEQ